MILYDCCLQSGFQTRFTSRIYIEKRMSGFVPQPDLQIIGDK
jgi:hypothetical protein